MSAKSTMPEMSVARYDDETLHEKLRLFTGKKNARFQGVQEACIKSILEGRDTLGIMPTGGGKSVCYQIPASILPYKTVVISPLLALIVDQLKECEGKIKACGLYGGSVPEEEEWKNAGIIFTTPESFCAHFNKFFKMEISLFVVDEYDIIGLSREAA